MRGVAIFKMRTLPIEKLYSKLEEVYFNECIKKQTITEQLQTAAKLPDK
jgi:hypothetical protein